MRWSMPVGPIGIYQSFDGDRIGSFELGQALLTIGAIQDEVGKHAEACAAYERSFDYFKEVPVEDLRGAQGIHSMTLLHSLPGAAQRPRRTGSPAKARQHLLDLSRL